jgi:phospholipid-transporting ATPase
MVYNTTEFSLSAEQLLLQGCHLRNTDHVYAAVVYTGNQTKVIKSKIKSKIKFPQNENFINNLLYFTILLQLIFASIFGILGTTFRYTWLTDVKF